MDENTKIGLVGFFDILGYQNLLERNEPETIAQEVLPMLTEIGKKVTERIKRLVKDSKADQEKKDRMVSSVDAIDWLVFSDTILITLPVDESDPFANSTDWLTFLVTAVILQCELFTAGLPTRGAIDYGKFFVKETCFAGRTIVNAYKLCRQVELAACVFSPVATEKFRRADQAWTEIYGSMLYGSYVIEYLVPMKECEQHMLAVMAHTYAHDHPNIHATVMHAFWGNRKDIPQSARSKASNTEQWLEFLDLQQKKKSKGK